MQKLLIAFLRLRNKTNMKDVKIDETWKKVLEKEFKKPYWKDLTEFVRQQYLSGKIYPPAKSIFRAFDLCPLDSVKVVIVGQDPYHGANQANDDNFY